MNDTPGNNLKADILCQWPIPMAISEIRSIKWTKKIEEIDGSKMHCEQLPTGLSTSQFHDDSK